jgi:TolA-binding protein
MHLEESLKLCRAKLGPDHPFTLDALYNLAGVYHDQGDFARAEACLREVIVRGTSKFGADVQNVTNARYWLGLTLFKQQKAAEAEPVLREFLATRQKNGSDLWSYFSAQSLLGCSLLGQAKYTDAEPLLVRGYEGMKQREAQIPAGYKAHLSEALERLVQLYDATGQTDEAAKWRAERAKYGPPPAPPVAEKK